MGRGGSETVFSIGTSEYVSGAGGVSVISHNPNA